MDDAVLTCPNCDTPSQSGRFCGECGSALRPARCPGCGEIVSDGAKFCRSCGARLTVASTRDSVSPASTYANWTTANQTPSPGANWMRRAGPAAHGGEATPAPEARRADSPSVSEPSQAAIDDWMAPLRFAPNATHAVPPVAGWRPSWVRALAVSGGRFLAVFGGLCYALIAAGVLSNQAGLETAGGVAAFLLPFTFWIGSTVWAQRSGGWKWAGAFFLFWPVALPWLTFRRIRQGTHDGGRRFPAFWAAGTFAVIGSMLIIASIFNRVPERTAVAGPVSSVAGQPEAGDPEQSLAAVQPTASLTPSATATTQPTIPPTATNTPSPEPTATRTPKPTRTPTPRPTRTPKPRPTSTPRPSASYDPDQAAELLHDAPYRSDEYIGISYPSVSWSDDPATGSVAQVVVVTDAGLTSYAVFPSDRAAKRFVESKQSGLEYSMPEYPGYETAVGYAGDGVYYYMAAVGNVVVMTLTSDEYLILTGLYDPSYSTDVFAAAATDYGVRHMLRVLGDADSQPADTSNTL